MCDVAYNQRGQQEPPFEQQRIDAAFIAACSKDVPALIAEVERLRAILTQNRDDCPVCFGEGEELHLGENGKLFETGACKVCSGTGCKQASTEG